MKMINQPAPSAPSLKKLPAWLSFFTTTLMLLGLYAALAAATLIEKHKGTDAALAAVYHSSLFFVLLALMALNFIAAMLNTSCGGSRASCSPTVPSYNADEHDTILAVNRNVAGRTITYCGYALLALGLILSILGPHTHFNRLVARLGMEAESNDGIVVRNMMQDN